MIPLPEWLAGIDQDLFRWINATLHDARTDAVETVLAFANQTGNAVLALPLVAAAWILGRRGRVLFLLQVMIALALVGWVNGRLKLAFARPRPQTALEQEFASGEVKGAFGERQRRLSFPSGHSATYAALATLLAAWSRRLPGASRRRFALFVLVVGWFLVALARIYAGSHFPLDVLAGAVLGIACGLGGLAVSAVLARTFTALRGPRAPDLAANAGWTP